jgi:stress response protein YsnF
MSSTSESTINSAFSMFDLMLNVQRAGLRAMTVYQPVASAFLNTAKALQPAPLTGERTIDVSNSDQEQVIGIGEEVLSVGTRMVQGKTTRVRRVVVQTPVQQDVTLHTETVVLERRRPIATNSGDVLTEVTFEMSDFNEVPVVSKAVHLVEEVLLRKEVTARTETIHETVKRDKLEIEQPSQLPVLVSSVRKRDDKKQTGDSQGKK